DDEPAFAGRFFSFGPAKAAPKPWQRRRMPIAVGGNRPPALRRVARAGDCWHALGVNPDGIRTRLRRLDELLADEGRTRADIVISLRYDVPRDATTASVVERCAAYRDAGVSEVVVSLGSPDLDAQRRLLDTVAADVLPALC